jgi:hypothetical protein
LPVVCRDRFDDRGHGGVTISVLRPWCSRIAPTWAHDFVPTLTRLLTATCIGLLTRDR